ncbi:MAG: peptidoglycan-binding protein [Alphaproteobacteria bacterium]
MTQGPWSIKGIDPRARSAAREQAQQRGVTLGQYLNSLLLDEEAIRVDGVEVADFHASDAAPDEMRRMSAEIDLLAQRIEASQARSARTIAGVDKSILGVMGKLDVSNRAQLAGLERVSRAMTDIEATQSALRTRIETIESGGGSSGQTVSALKSLEASLAHLAETVNEQGVASAREQAEFHDLFDKKVSRVSERVDNVARNLDTVVGDAIRSTSAGITGRIDEIEQQVQAAERRMDGALGRITDAASRFELFENKAERAVTDTTWRMERALETSVQRSRAMSKELLDRVDGIDEKTRDAISQLGEAVNRITQRIGQAERSSGSAITALERSVTNLDDRFSKMPPGGDVEEIKSLFQERLDTLAADLSRPMHAVRADVERKVEEAIRSNQPEKVERLERTIRELQQRLQDAESRQAGAVETISDQVDRMSRAVDERLRAVEGRADDRSIEDVRREMLRLADTIDSRLGGAEATAKSTTTSLERLSNDVARVPGLLEDRIQESERRSAAAIDVVGEQVGVMAERLQRRHDESTQRLNAKIEETGRSDLTAEEFNRFAQSFDERVRESERRSAEAIGQIGEQVARAAERLQNQHLESLRMLETRLTDSGRQHESRLTEALADVTRRMDEIGEQSATALNPVHKTVSSIARRIAAIEDGVQMGKAPERSIDDAIPDLPDDYAFLDVADDPIAPPPPLPRIPPVTAAERAMLMAEIEPELEPEAETSDIVGVEPPPFDRTPDAHLFADPTASADAALAADASAAAPAENIDDLLETDDMVLAPPTPANEFTGELPANEPGDLHSASYIAEARRAAMQGRRVPLVTQVAAKEKRGIGRGPLIASAALAVAVAGGGAWTVMRGKQEATTDTFTKLSPQAPQPSEGDPKAAAAVLFGDEPETTVHADAAVASPAAKPAATAASAQADDIFDATPPWNGPGKAPEAKTTTAAAKTAVAPSEPVEPTITLVDAAAHGDPVALHDQAVELLKGPDKARAVGLLKEAAGKGLVMAQYRLAKLYEKGEGAPRDMAASRKWTEQAAMGGNVKAMHDLAVFYAEGDAGPQSYAAAVEWFRQASDLGLVDSQYNLAVLYEQGLGVSEDKVEAAYWFEVAGKSGDPDGLRRARGLESSLTSSDTDQIKRRARAYTAKSGNARANGDLGKRPWDVASPAQIAETQRLLDRLGYAPGKVDGKAHPATAEAIRKFEKDNKLPLTGEASISLLRQLKAATLNAN